MLVWNYNEESPGEIFGAKDVNVAVSQDGLTWTNMGTFTLNAAPGNNTCSANTTVDLNGVVAKFVQITLLTSWADMDIYGLSEVRFLVAPTYATQPVPDDGDDDIAIDPTLSWESGRGVIEHNVYLSTDEAAVIAGTVNPQTTTESSYGPLSLNIQSTYYWRVDEVNNLADYTTWQGDVWSFTTADSVIVEDFEDYNGTPSFTVYDTWQDGYSVPAYGGSQMGHFGDPYVETTIRHGGSQSAPLYYDNATQTKSEVVANTSSLPIGSNWTAGGADTLVIWFRGSETNAATDQLYAKLNNTKVVYNGAASDISRTAWTRWEIPLAGIALDNVSSITIGLERIGATGGSGLLYLDDLELVIGVEAVDPGTSNLIARYEMENNVQDSSGNALNGTANNDPTYGAGKSGMALMLDGIDDYVDLPIGTTISTLTDCTISVWVNWAGGGVWQRVYDFGNGAPDNMWLCPDSTTNLRFALKAAAADGREDQANAPELSPNNWEQVTVVVDTVNSTISMYLNGNLVATNTNLNTLPSDMGVTPQNWIGRSQYDADPYFSGMVDDLRIYNRALSASEVRYIYEN